MQSKSLPCVGALLIIAGCLSAQTQVTINPSKDNTLFEDNNGSLSNGAGTRCFAGRISTGGLKRRAVMAFNVRKQVPAGSTITKADLVLNIVQAPSFPAPTSVTVSLHTLTADWGEGSSAASGAEGGGASAATNDATWIHTFYSNNRWSTAGGDFNSTASGSTSVGTSGAATWASTTAMVADVQSWLDKPATSFGWLLLGDESTTQTARAFSSKEDQTASNRPRLIVTYTPPKAQATSTGTGCRGTGNANVVLSAKGLPTIGNSQFGLTLTGGPGGKAAIGLALSLLGSPVALGGGCSLYVNTLPIFVVFPGSSVPLPIPNNTKFIGTTLHWQGAMEDPKTTFLLTSNALTTRVGV